MHLRRFFARRALRIQAGILATNTWVNRTGSPGLPVGNWMSVCWSPELGMFVAVSYSGTYACETSRMS